MRGQRRERQAGLGPPGSPFGKKCRLSRVPCGEMRFQWRKMMFLVKELGEQSEELHLLVIVVRAPHGAFDARHRRWIELRMARGRAEIPRCREARGDDDKKSGD